jgi:hypothetical protein
MNDVSIRMTSGTNIDRLIKALHSPRVQRRTAAALELGSMHANEAVESLSRMLGDPNLRARTAAAWALACIGGHPISHLRNVLLVDKGLSVVGLELLLDALKQLIGDQDGTQFSTTLEP